MDEQRIENIAELAGVEYDEAEGMINGDWPNADEHAAWLEAASDEEIASWVEYCLG